MIIDFWYKTAIDEEQPVEFSIKNGSPEKHRSACVVVGVFEARKLTLAAEAIDKAANNYLSDAVSYTHLDVYKRQVPRLHRSGK